MKLLRTIILLICLTIVGTADAVLKEDSLVNTLRVLRSELTDYHDDYTKRQMVMKDARQQVFTTLMETMQSSNQNALMLYSQKEGYVFDLSYACHEAIEQYQDFKRKLIPFMEFVDQSDNEEARFDSLINCLKTMPVMMLSPQAKVDRNVCLALAVNTQRMVKEDHDQLKEYIMYYKMTEARLKNLNDYANKKYSELQSSIFVNGGDNYFDILSKFGYYLTQTKESIYDKYSTNEKVHSQWDSRWIVGLFVVILFYGFIAVALNQLIVRWLITKLIKKGYGSVNIAETFMAKRTMIIMASTVITFAVILGVVKALADQNFIQMAAGLLVQYSWLLSVVIISLLLRTKPELALKTFFVYLPLIVNGFIVISFRIILIPNALVNLIFPPLLLVCCVWQWYVLRKWKNHIDISDKSYAYCSQFVFVVSLVCSMIGYTLLSVQILIWWIMQLTCILTITCFRDWYRAYSERKKLKEKPITETWHHAAIYWVLLPVCGVFSVVISLYWAADVFNLSDLTLSLFTKKFINTENFSASIFSIAQVITLWFIFNYVNHTSKAMAQYYLQKRDPKNAAQRFMMVKNVMQIFIWGVWVLMTMAMFHMSNTWLVVVSGGLSTGIGFASKDILENIYYGISLMAGRIKIGDLIVCDGVRGTVASISYTSTMINTTDGSVIAFQNSQLFTKNYKNMTRNHGYELHILDVGVAYGTNIKQAREVITKAVLPLDNINKKKGVNVVLKELGDSALVLKVIVWVNVFTQYADDGVILEAIYNALNENNIEIPFPQTDVHIKS